MLNYTDEYVADLQNIRNLVPNIEKLENKKILVTGAGGLICSAVVDFLLEIGVQVYAAGRDKGKIETRFQKRVFYSNFYFFHYDATEVFSATEDFDFIIHGASNADPRAIINYPVEAMVANINGIRNLLEYSKSHFCRVLYISSSEVYGKKKGDEPYNENDLGYLDILNPRACYPSSKRAAETLCASYKKEYGVDVVIVRPGHIYGPTCTDRDSRVASQFPRDVKAGKNITLKSDGLQMRSYCYVLDCVSAIITVLLNGISGEAYNISNKNSVVNIREMAEYFAKASGQSVLFEKAAAREKEGYNLMDNSSLDGGKLEALGWRGLFNMAVGARKTLEAMY